jgi:hypothetical protein
MFRMAFHGTRAEVCCALRRSGTCRGLRLGPELRDWLLIRRRHVKGGNNDSRVHLRHGSSVPGNLWTWETGERGEKCGTVATQPSGGVGFEKGEGCPGRLDVYSERSPGKHSACTRAV